MIAKLKFLFLFSVKTVFTFGRLSCCATSWPRVNYVRVDEFKWLVLIIPLVTPVGHVNLECFLTSTCNMAEMKKNLPSVNMIVNLKMKMKPQNKPFYRVQNTNLNLIQRATATNLLLCSSHVEPLFHSRLLKQS